MASREEAPQVNAGSMADIAFLLLIFFLVTTTIDTDEGLERLLPKIDADSTKIDYYKRNILTVMVDKQGKLLVNENLADIRELRNIASRFLDNGGAKVDSINYCDYCKGDRTENSSDGPEKAIVTLMSDRETSYGTYISVQNELVAAYNQLRNREAQRLYKMDYNTLEALYAHPQTSFEEKEKLKAKIKYVQGLYPMKLTETQYQ